MMTLPNRPGYVVVERKRAEAASSHEPKQVSYASPPPPPLSSHFLSSSHPLAHYPQTLSHNHHYNHNHQYNHQHGLLYSDLEHLGYIPSQFPLSVKQESSPRLAKQTPSSVSSTLTSLSSAVAPSSSPSPYSALDLVNDITPDTSSRPFDPFKLHTIDHLTPEEIQDKKTFVQKHPLHPHMLQIIDYCKREGIIPTLSNTIQPSPMIDYTLSEFLESQGIDTHEADAEGRGGGGGGGDRDEFTLKLQQLRSAYNEELDKLNKVCLDFVNRMVALLREQGQIRQVTDQEIQAKGILIQNKFDYVRQQLRTNVCNAILVLQKQYHQNVKKRRRSLSKKATDALNQWFFEHINDPYPSDEEKSMLAAQCVLSLNQVNNWFGNKRIRYKRKCLEDETRMRHSNKNTSSPLLSGPSSPNDLNGSTSGSTSPSASPDSSPQL